MTEFKLNVKQSPIDRRDWKVSAIYPKMALPEVVDHVPNMQPIRDQGTQGSCAAMGGAAMKEWQENKDVGLNEYMSPQFIYNNREDLTEEGMYMRDLMEILKEKGDCLEKLFPYGTMGKPSIEVLMNASKYKTLNYASIDTIDDLKISLYTNGPCIIAIPVYNYTERLWFKRPGDTMLGGHAMCVAGYNKYGFAIRNSWGTGWGQNGYCLMPYEDFGMQWELWSTCDDTSFEPEPVPPTPPEPERKGCLYKFFNFK